MKAFQPIILLGPGRGGTTLLYKLLALHPCVSFISNYDVHPKTRMIAGPAVALTRRATSLKRAAWFAKDGQAYLLRRTLMKRLVPAPVEGEQIYASCGLTLSEQLASPVSSVLDNLRHTFREIQQRQRGDVLLLKRTANNRRIPPLLAAFPNCKFLVLWRDGRAVASSLLAVNWWLDHSVWWAANQTPRSMNLDRSGMIELAARNWVMEVEAIHRGLNEVSFGKQFHLKYEDLVAQPQSVLTKVLDFLGLFPTEHYQHVVDTIGLSSRPETWQEQFSGNEKVLIERIAGKHIVRLGYELTLAHDHPN